MPSFSPKLLLASAALALAWFFLMPSLLYQGDTESLGLQFGNFLVVSALATVAATALLYLIGTLLKSRVDLAPLFTALALAVVIKAVLLPSSVPVLDGETPFFRLSTRQGIWSIVYFLAAVGIAALAVRKFGTALAGPLLAAIAAMGLLPLLEPDNWSYQIARGKDVTPFLEFSRDKDNVLVLLIDTFQSDVFAEILDSDPKLRAAFEGFTLFHNTVANAPFTLMAMMPIYSGETYQGGSIKAFYGGVRKSSLFTDFEEMGFDTSLAGLYYFDSCPAQRCYRRQHLSSQSALARDFSRYFEDLDLSALNVVPTFLHKWLYNGGSGRSKGLFPLEETGPAGNSVSAVKFIADGLTDTATRPTLKFIHVMITHSPVVLNDACRTGKQRSLTRENYRAQALCAVRSAVGLLDSLRKAGLYKKTSIVVMADHGASIGGSPPDQIFLGEVKPRSASTGGRFNPLFAVKPKGASGPLKLSSAPLQSSDLRATLCGMTADCKLESPGRNAWTVAPGSERTRTFIDYGAWAHRHSTKNDVLPLDKVVSFTIGGGIDELPKVYDITRRAQAGPE